MVNFFLGFFFLLTFTLNSYSQYSFSKDTTSFQLSQKQKIIILSTAYLRTLTAIHNYQSDAWWKNFRQPFHFREDLKYGANVDKVGHFWGANFSSFLISRSLEWSEVEKKDALIYGAIGGTLFELYIEFEDGFSKWGFDRVDAISNIVGGFYPVLQNEFPILQNVNFKASYYPRKLNEPGNISGQKHIIIDDYEGQTLWLSFKTNTFLCPAIGYSVRGTGKGEMQTPICLIGLDIDFEKIIPQNNFQNETIAKFLNFIRFPLPAVRIYPNIVCYGIYF